MQCQKCIYNKGEKVLTQFNDKSIYILTIDREDIIAKYARSKDKGKRKFRIWYMINKLINKSNGFLDSEEYKSMPKPEKLILEKIFKNDSNEFLKFIEHIKDKPRNLIHEFVYRHKNRLEDFTPGLLMSEIIKI